jgi:WD40 repeat protein
MSQVDSTLRELVEAFVNGETTAEQGAELESRLTASPEARDYYLDYMNLHSALRRRFLLPQEPERPIETQPASEAEMPRRGWTGIGLAILASGVVLAGLILAVWPHLSGDGEDRLATVRSVEGEVVRLSSTGQTPAKAGDLLRPGDTLRVEGEDGSAAIEYADGTVIRLQSGSVVRSPVDRAVRLDLLAGAMEVVAGRPASQEAAIFSTQHSRYVARGTHFRLYHDEASSRLEIEQGKVRLERPARGESVEVGAGNVAISAPETPVEIRPLAFGSGELTQTLRAAGQKVTLADDDRTLVTNNWQNGLRVWSLGDKTPRHQYLVDPADAEGLALAKADAQLVMVTRGGKVISWRPGAQEALTIPLAGRNTRSRCLSPEGSVVAESSDGATTVYDIDVSGGTLRERRAFTDPGKAWCLALSRQGELLAGGFWDGTVRVIDTRTGEIRWERRLAHTPTHLDLTADGQRLVVFTQKDGIKQIDLATGEQRTLAEPSAGTVRCLRFDPSGRYVLAGLNDRTARMWSVEDGRQLLVIDAGHSPQGIAWSEEEQVLVTADGDVKLWKCDLMKETIQ